MRNLLFALMLLPAAGWASADNGTEKCTLKSKSSVCQQRVQEAHDACQSEGVRGDENLDVCAMGKMSPKGVKVERMTTAGTR